MKEQIYFILEQHCGHNTFDDLYTSDKGTVMYAMERSKNTGKNIKVYYFPQMKEIKNFSLSFKKEKANKSKGEK